MCGCEANVAKAASAAVCVLTLHKTLVYVYIHVIPCRGQMSGNPAIIVT